MRHGFALGTVQTFEKLLLGGHVYQVTTDRRRRRPRPVSGAA
ncbi:hypothetical protein B005_2837 [Nocardiopsis alba ATCC BAA-2165]|uniref:Uncharacterized protein n=1 Tax=Nocardiopsis alba (strain ATCC BAA-2165 / BE74) TaxID=1205910 RepID=J7KXB5_NOCAA|nr:hypothetical protein B005_2837 [Nocardiopsis alba ATCC BAA-2165]